ncbi:hypothetical protein DB347_14455 [Opitutaceae bacterium EW11]|nr:hypothetical protein DB347_14455 [Opitutaceae bacterium EW11]
MKALRFAGLAAVLLAAPLVSRAAETEPAYLDFANVTPAEHGEYVDIDLDQGLLKLAALFADKQEKEAADVLRGLKHVRVHVLSLDDGNRSSALERVQSIRKSLETDGWKRIVTVKEEKSDDVAIFARIRGEEAIEGLAITVVEGNRQAVVVNVAGEIRPDQISALGARFNIDPLKKLQVAKN